MIGLISPATLWAQPESSEQGGPCCGCTDCNGNGVDDACDLSCSNSGIFCLGGLPANDLCNSGNFPSCGTSLDCNRTGVPDECGETIDVPEWYVDPDAPGDQTGTSWENAKLTLQEALACAVAGNEIWVVAGTYYATDDLDRNATFTLKHGVNIYGGFAGGEGDANDRNLPSCLDNHPNDDIDYAGLPCVSEKDCGGDPCDYGVNATILSGDLAGDDAVDPEFFPGFFACFSGDDVPLMSGCEAYNTDNTNDPVNDVDEIDGNIDDNSRHVVTYDTPNAQVTLDGVVIQGGTANGISPPHNQGGAVQIREDVPPCIAGGPTLANCLIRFNFATDHGAVNDHAAHTTITNCSFRHNRSGGVGAALVVDNGEVTIQGCLFENNTAIVGDEDDPSGGEGGAVWISSRATCPAIPSSVTDSAFHDNQSKEGGALWADTDVTIDGCTFLCNKAIGSVDEDPITGGTIDVQGGGVWLGNTTSATTVTDCLFHGNDAADAGGGLFVRDQSMSLTSGPTIANCLFRENSTLRYAKFKYNVFYGEIEGVGDCVVSNDYGGGAGLWIEGYRSASLSSAVTVRDCDFVRNESVGRFQYGGGMFLHKNAHTFIENCEFYGNRAGDGGAVWDELGGTATECPPQPAPTRYVNCVFVANHAFPGSGGEFHSTMYLDNSDVEMTNCTVVHNSCSGPGGAIRVTGTVVLKVRNCVLGDNCSTEPDSQISCGEDATVDIDSSIWQGYDALNLPGCTLAEIPENMPDGAPDFASDPDPDPDDEGDGWDVPICDVSACPQLCFRNDDYGDLHLCAGSPAIDAGDDAAAAGIATDLDGNPRIVGSVDLGAYESGTTCTDDCVCAPASCCGITCCSNTCCMGVCCPATKPYCCLGGCSKKSCEQGQ